MPAEDQLRSALHTWKNLAKSHVDVEDLPTDEILEEIAKRPELLRSKEHAAELHMWAKPLRRVIGFAQVGKSDVIESGGDPSLFEPDLSGQVLHESPGTEANDVVIPEVAPAAAPVSAPESTPEEVALTSNSGGRHSDNQAGKISAAELLRKQEKSPESKSKGGRRRRARVEEPTVEDRNLRSWESYEFSRLDAFASPSPIPGANLRITPNAVGGLDLDWHVPPSETTGIRLFRIVSDEQDFESDPDCGEHRAVTVGTNWADNEPLTTAYRMYQVWMYEGSSESNAVRSQPTFVGEKAYINPIEAIELSAAGSEVKGQWISAEHTHRVAVFAVPVSERLTLARRNEIATDTPNLQGFRFEPQHRGREYKFVAQRFVNINGLELASAPSEEFIINVPAEVVDVPITVEEHDNGFDTTFRISWEPPHSGEVWIYRTAEAPDPELQFNEIEVDQLEAFGLARRDWANDLEDDVSTCAVTWPDDWYSIFITPVNVVGNQAQVGKTHSRVRVGEISNATLHERVNSQLMTFGWPEEAHEVTAVFGEPGGGHLVGPTADTPGTSLVSIHQEAYEEEGGMRFPLPGPGDIALFASRVYEGQQIWGEPVILNYRGVRKFRYRFRFHSGRLFLAIFSDREDAFFDHFTLRIHNSRLPLEPDDGDEVLTRAIDGTTNSPEEPDFSPGIASANLRPEEREVARYWEIDPQVANYPHTSYLRLFVRQPEDKTAPVKALIDPEPAQLRLRTWTGA